VPASATMSTSDVNTASSSTSSTSSLVHTSSSSASSSYTVPEQMMVRFVTSLPAKLRVAPTPFAIPTRLARRGLSEVINHLLQLDPPHPFEFLVDSDILRTTIAAHLKRTKRSLVSSSQRCDSRACALVLLARSRAHTYSRSLNIFVRPLDALDALASSDVLRYNHT
jgi:NLE (NUC135) domain